MAIAFLNNVTIDGYLDIGKNELRNARIDNLTTTEINAISSPVAGQIAYDSTVNKLKFYNGTSWGEIDGGSGTVTSVGITAGAGVAVTGSPITTSGSITVGVDGVLEDLDTLGAPTADGQFIVATGAGAFAYESGATARTSLGLGSAATAASSDFLAPDNNLSDLTEVETARTNLGLGDLATLDAVGASEITDNSVGAAELNVSGNGTTGYVLTSDGDGSFSWSAKTTNTDNDVNVANLTSRLAEITENVTIGDATDVTVTTSGNLSVTGDLIVSGTTTTVNSTTVTIDDPIFTLGGDTAPSSDDNKDRGIEFRWHNGSAAKLGFFGFDDSTGYFTFIADGTNTSEVFSGTKGTIDVSAIRLDDSGLVLNGTAVDSTAAELNVLDGITATTAELNILDGVTATATEINILDGVTSTTAELNILDGVTATASEINTLDGITATTTELNYVDGVTSAIQTQLDTKTKRYAAEVTTSGGSATIAAGTHGLDTANPPIVNVYDENGLQVFPEITHESDGDIAIRVNTDATFDVVLISTSA